MNVRAAIKVEIESVEPLDEKERATQREVLDWIASGKELCRIEKPDVPPVHLVSYFAVVDDDHLLLVDHRNAGLWLPTGGHVEPNEHPRAAALREAREELNLEAEFLVEQPVLLTRTETVGATAGHTDVSIWYVLAGNRHAPLQYDESEFNDARWFRRGTVPLERTDPEMSRFLKKLRQMGI